MVAGVVSAAPDQALVLVVAHVALMSIFLSAPIDRLLGCCFLLCFVFHEPNRLFWFGYCARPPRTY